MPAAAKQRLIALIEQRDEPLASLAVKIGVSQSTLWNFIHGDTKNFSKIHALARELNVSLDWIMRSDRPPPAADSKARHLSEPDNDQAAEPGPPPSERLVIREIAWAAARLGREQPAMTGSAIAAAALTLYEALKKGRLPAPAPRAARLSKPVEDELGRLIAYERARSGK